jgi:hypothetical protein
MHIGFARVIPLFKGVKAEYIDNYRPISILSGTRGSTDKKLELHKYMCKACMHIGFMKDILDFLFLHSDSLNCQT